MSKNWAGGTTSAWRRIRATILARDGYRCRMGDPTHPIGKHQPQSPDCTGGLNVQVHHTLGRAVTGDDPGFLIAACRTCNLAVGDPAKHEPQPKIRSKWARR